MSQLDGFELYEGEDRSGTNGVLNLVRYGQDFIALDPLACDEAVLHRFLSGLNRPRERIMLITPELRQALIRQHMLKKRLHEAVHGLAERYEGLSAREKTTYMQKLLLAFLFGLLGGGLVLSPVSTLYVLGGLLNLLFFYSIALRLYAAATFERDRAFRQQSEINRAPERLSSKDLPVYSILVPLFREHRVIGQLVEHLLALDYPRDRLDIKLILEQDDDRTLAAANSLDLPDCFELVIVPPALPRTKPKALNYALPLVEGRYVVVFDAEDRPEKDQLRKAVAAFARADAVAREKGRGIAGLACLQAGLNHYNVEENWLARQFTIEYTALFDGLLPALQRLDLPIPLGGTSNHFRTDILRRIGGWDAFNVTEDADLGIRLVRFGYRCAMLPSTTYEEACCRPRDWVRQRTRWLKGWLQTWLVHMRHPAALFRQLGARGFAGFQIILGAQVLSLIAHPVFILFMSWEAWSGHLFQPSRSLFGSLFHGLALGNFILGYSAAIWLGLATLRARGLGRLGWQLLLMPLYWLLISFATFRALVHYIVKPFHWEKTEHGARGQPSNS